MTNQKKYNTHDSILSTLNRDGDYLAQPKNETHARARLWCRRVGVGFFLVGLFLTPGLDGFSIIVLPSIMLALAYIFTELLGGGLY